MQFTEHLEAHYHQYLASLIDAQLATIGGGYEKNMEHGVEYEKCLERRFPELISRRVQKQNGEKCDVVFLTEPLELKTGQFDFDERYHRNYNKKRRWRFAKYHTGDLKYVGIPYRKPRGDSEPKIDRELLCPIIVYQKFNIEENIPAALGYIDKQSLVKIIDENRFEKKRADLFLVVTRDDFGKHFYKESQIPTMLPGFVNALGKIEDDISLLRYQEIELCVAKHKSGNFYTCKDTTTPVKHGKRATSEDIAAIVQMLNDGQSITAICQHTGFRSAYIVKLQNKLHKKALPVEDRQGL